MMSVKVNVTNTHFLSWLNAQWNEADCRNINKIVWGRINLKKPSKKYVLTKNTYQ